jgi:hypothetical protein
MASKIKISWYPVFTTRYTVRRGRPKKEDGRPKTEVGRSKIKDKRQKTQDTRKKGTVDRNELEISIFFSNG